MSDKLKAWIVYGVIAVVLVGMTWMAGCSLGDIVRVRTPTSIQADTGLPATLSLNDAKHEYQRWVQDVHARANQWAENIEGGERWLGILSAIANTGISEVSPALAAIPGGGAAVAILGLLGGYFTRGAREAKVVREREDKAYDTALHDLTDSLKTLGITVPDGVGKREQA